MGFIKRLCNLHDGSVAFSACILGSTMMHSVFTFYYVKVFLNRFHINENWFQASQVLYMLWNAINDPLFGYLQDTATMRCVKSRRNAILYSAPLFVVSFLVPWFQWRNYEKEWAWLGGLHLMLALCFYDAMYTFVGLARNCIFTEMSTKHEDRLRLIQYSQVASMFGSSSILICEFVSKNLTLYSSFQVTTVVIAIVSYFCHRYTGLHAHTEYERKQALKISDNQEDTKCTLLEAPDNEAVGGRKLPFWRTSWQILTQRNFIFFVGMNFFQEFHRTFATNFVSIFVDSLVSKDDVPSGLKSVFFGSLFILPQVCVMLGTPLVSRFGHYYVIRATFLMKAIVPIIMFYIGRHHSYILIAYLLFDSTQVNAVYNLFALSLSEIADEDMERHQRSHPISAMIFGLNALVVKPAISLAPMGVVTLLNDYSYTEYEKGKLLKPQDIARLHNVMFYLICAVPLVLGLVQLILWSQYTIRHTHVESGKITEVSVDI